MSHSQSFYFVIHWQQVRLVKETWELQLRKFYSKFYYCCFVYEMNNSDKCHLNFWVKNMNFRNYVMKEIRSNWRGLLYRLSLSFSLSPTHRGSLNLFYNVKGFLTIQRRFEREKKWISVKQYSLFLIDALIILKKDQNVKLWNRILCHHHLFETIREITVLSVDDPERDWMREKDSIKITTECETDDCWVIFRKVKNSFRTSSFVFVVCDNKGEFRVELLKAVSFYKSF